MDFTLVYVRCSCWFPIGKYQTYFENALKAGLTPKQAIDRLELPCLLQCKNCLVTPAVYPNNYDIPDEPHPGFIVNGKLSNYPEEIDSSIGTFYMTERTAPVQLTTNFTNP
jgi:hypothetical protein